MTKEDLAALYPAGSKLILTADIDDPYTPKHIGDIFIVSHIDDKNQIHGRWENGGSMALIYGVDMFEVLEKWKNMLFAMIKV